MVNRKMLSKIIKECADRICLEKLIIKTGCNARACVAEVFCGLLGYTKEKSEMLKEEKVI